jgi:antitoxin (DNA-binding transcriptional repressor) of toxin-antitoxin stability system
MTIERGRSRQISELQSDAAGVVAQAEHGPVEIRRYSEPVAYIESVRQHREHQELDAALNRAIWALDLARAMGDVKDGNFERWEKVAATLRTRYPKP